MSATTGKVLGLVSSITYRMESAGVMVTTTWFSAGEYPTIHLLTASGDATVAAATLGLGLSFRHSTSATEDIESWRGTVDGIEVSVQHTVPAASAAVTS